eukprot:scaffold216899_cov21-Prasinocladus_malaysianus.AAC.1
MRRTIGCGATEKQRIYIEPPTPVSLVPAENNVERRHTCQRTKFDLNAALACKEAKSHCQILSGLPRMERPSERDRGNGFDDRHDESYQ